MGKPISKKVAQRLRRSAKAIESSAAAEQGTSKTKAAGIAGAAIAGAAGVAAAVRYMRNGAPVEEVIPGPTTLHVQHNGEGWVLVSEGEDEPVDTFLTKKKAVSAGREVAQNSAPSELIIHRADGSEEESHRYQPA
jgi:hypothetical protein